MASPVRSGPHAVPMLDERGRLRLLAGAGALIAGSLDYRDTLHRVVQFVVPQFADLCSVDLLEDDALHCVAVAHADAEMEALLDAIPRSYQPDPASSYPLLRVIRSRRPEFSPGISDEQLREVARDERALRLLRRLDPQSGIVVPLLAGTEAIGAMSFVFTRSGREYTPEDLLVAVQLGREAGTAIENARLYQQAEQAADDLRTANRAKDEFLGLASHELRTPLTTILGNAEILMKHDRAIGAASRMQAFTDIHDEAERLRRIIENLLALARLDGDQQMHREPLILRHLIASVIAEHGRRHPQRALSLDAQRPTTTVIGDGGYLEQVVRNLLSNAEKYSPPGAPIEVTIRREGSDVVVRVLDRGIGIEPGEAERLFSPFYRADAAAGRAAGMGIGLTVCKRLVDAQGGRIWASPRPDSGAEFGFALPAVDDEASGS